MSLCKLLSLDRLCPARSCETVPSFKLVCLPRYRYREALLKISIEFDRFHGFSPGFALLFGRVDYSSRVTRLLPLQGSQERVAYFTNQLRNFFLGKPGQKLKNSI
jgi:hypothetical protein